MTDPKPKPDTQPEIRAIAVVKQDGKEYLYAVSTAGKLLPLYVYGPLVNPVTRPGDVPFLDAWPDYSRDYAKDYYPVPELREEQLPKDIRDDFWGQVREDPSRPWDQAVYGKGGQTKGGYPLYIYGDGTKDDPATGTVPPDKAHMFQRATTDLTGGPIGQVTIDSPPSGCGP